MDPAMPLGLWLLPLLLVGSARGLASASAQGIGPGSIPLTPFPQGRAFLLGCPQSLCQGEVRHSYCRNFSWALTPDLPVLGRHQIWPSLLSFFLLITGNNLEICLLPLERGPCRALIPRYYYDRNRQRCRKFKYGGCLGNANNFHSRDLCEHTCGNIESKWGCTGVS